MSETIINGLCASCPGACCGFTGKSWSLILTQPEATFMGWEMGGSIRRGAGVVERLKANGTYQDYLDGLASSDATAIRLLRMFPPDGHIYHFSKPCIHGTQQGDGSVICKAHNNPQRPNVCSDFQTGSTECTQLRRSLGVRD